MCSGLVGLCVTHTAPVVLTPTATATSGTCGSTTSRLLFLLLLFLGFSLRHTLLGREQGTDRAPCLTFEVLLGADDQTDTLVHPLVRIDLVGFRVQSELLHELAEVPEGTTVVPLGYEQTIVIEQSTVL